jgi:carboxyl-terminal processing protease
MKFALHRMSLLKWIVGVAVLLSSLQAISRAGDTPVNNGGVASGSDAMDLFAPTTQPATVDSLKTQAFHAMLEAKFGQSSQLLAAAANLSPDATTKRMANWAAQFEALDQTFSGARHEQFDKVVANIHTLINHNLETYAIDEANSAYTLADDPDAFRHEPWIDDLFKECSSEADHFEDNGQWLKALRMYADLAGLDPTNPVWKDKVKVATRRVRLLMTYAPDRLQKLEDLEEKDRKAADVLLTPSTEPSADSDISPSTQPDADASTQPSGDLTAATQSDDLVDDTNDHVDWHDVTRGVQYSMLWDALVLTEKEYYKEADYKTLMEGGLSGLRAVVTTPGLEDAFPGLADRDACKKFTDAIDSCLDDAKNVADRDQEDLLLTTLDRLQELNKQTVNIPEEVFVSEFADGAFGELDPFTTMIWPYEVPEFQKNTQGKFGGVGIQIEADNQGNLRVVTPLEDTPAYHAGVKAGYVITKIDGKKALHMPIDAAVKLITGDPDTTVTLTMRDRSGVSKDFVLKREEIKVESIKGYTHAPGGGWDYMLDPDQKIAYIRLTNFTESTSDDLDAALKTLKDEGARGMVLDLRYDPGGLLQAAEQVVNKFVADGVIVSTRADRDTSNHPTMAMADPKLKETDLPLLVLVNQYSASASEIVSGALKDHHRALLVGERTFGKGSVQMLFPLDAQADMACLKLTTMHYYLPSGRCIHREENSTTWGVDPDVVVPMTPEQMGAVNNARQELDVLSDTVDNSAGAPTTQPAQTNLLNIDPQLSAALMILRMELNGAQL